MIDRFCAAVAVATLTAFVAAPALAQTPPAKTAPKAAPAPATKAPAAPAAPAPAAPGAATGNSFGASPVTLLYTPWFKMCQKPPQPQPGQGEVCITTKTGLLEIGQPVISVAIITVQGDPKKILRLTMPLGVELARGTQVYVDTNTAKELQFGACMAEGCMAQVDPPDDVIAAMKSGQNLISRAFDITSGQLITLQLSVGPEFAKVVDGPATDPAVIQQKQKELQDIVQKNQQQFQQQQQQQQPQPGGFPPPTTPAPAKK